MAAEDHTTPVEYRPIPNYPGYAAGDDGSIWSCAKIGGRAGEIGLTWRRRAPRLDANTGYYCLCIGSGERVRGVTVHTLILEAFVGPKPAEHWECRHLNGIKTDNRLLNLKWGTMSENHEDRHRHGVALIGAKNHLAKLDNDKVREIHRMLGDKVPREKIARFFGVSGNTIGRIARREKWKHVV